MYTPEEFQIKQQGFYKSFLDEQKFGTIITNGENGFPQVSAVPFVAKYKGNNLVIEFHVAALNPHAAQLKTGKQAVMSVLGTHGYVSSSVYGHDNVPTYNYEMVLCKGWVKELNEEETMTHLNELVSLFEAKRKKPIGLEQMNPDLIKNYLPHIVCIRIEITETSGAVKMSQNRSAIDLNAIIKDAELNGQPELAQEIAKHRPE